MQPDRIAVVGCHVRPNRRSDIVGSSLIASENCTSRRWEAFAFSKCPHAPQVKMKHVVYLNRWNDLFHVVHAVVIAGTVHRRLDSRYCRTLPEARSVVAGWIEDHHVAAENVHDNSEIDLDVLFGQMEIDLDNVTDSDVAGVV